MQGCFQAHSTLYVSHILSFFQLTWVNLGIEIHVFLYLQLIGGGVVPVTVITSRADAAKN